MKNDNMIYLTLMANKRDAFDKEAYQAYASLFHTIYYNNGYDERVISEEDFIQECILYVMQKIKNFDESKGDIKTFCGAMAAHCYYDYYSRRFKEKDMQIESLYFENEGEECNICEMIPNGAPSHYKRLNHKAMLDCVANTLSKVKREEMRNVYIACKLNGYEVNEVAKAYGVPYSTVNNWVKRVNDKVLLDLAQAGYGVADIREDYAIS